MNTASLIQKVWNFCHTLRDDGVGYGDYLEQLTYLLFLKMAHEYTQAPFNGEARIPAGFDWPSLRGKSGEPLETQYLAMLHKLGAEKGMLGAIFFKAQSKIQDPAKLARLVKLIDEETWVGMDADTNQHSTLKARPLKLTDLPDFIDCYNSGNRRERRETERFKYFSCEDLVARDKASLDLFWLKDDSLDQLDDLPSPDVLQQEIIEHLEAALAAFRDVAAGLPVFDKNSRNWILYERT